MSIKALASGTLNIHQKGFCIVTFNMVHFRDKNDTHEVESLLPPGVTSFLLSLTTSVNPGSRQKAAIFGEIFSLITLCVLRNGRFSSRVSMDFK